MFEVIILYSSLNDISDALFSTYNLLVQIYAAFVCIVHVLWASITELPSTKKPIKHIPQTIESQNYLNSVNKNGEMTRITLKYVGLFHQHPLNYERLSRNLFPLK